MHFTALTTHLAAVSQAIRCESDRLARCEETINGLFSYLDARSGIVFPALLTRQAIQACQWYLEQVVPQQGFSEEDRRLITADYDDLLTRLHDNLLVAQHLEHSLTRVIRRLHQGTFRTERQAVRMLCESFEQTLILPPFPASPAFLRQFRRKIRSGLTVPQITALSKRLLKAMSAIEPSADTSLFSTVHLQEWLDYTVQGYMQGKCVLVDTFGQGIVMPLHVTVDPVASSPHVEFPQHNIDATMQQSADVARQVACHYLRQAAGRELTNDIAVRCRLPLPGVSYRDASASLLIALRIVGEILQLPPNPTTVVTGEVDRFGTILEVGWTGEKIEAAAAHPDIQRIILPQANDLMRQPVSHAQIDVVPVRTFTDAVECYYGKALQQVLAQITRRQMLKRAASFLVLPFSVLTVKNLFLTAPNPVSEADWRLLQCARDLYQKKSDHASAVTILETLLSRFARETVPEAVQIQAFALGQLGVIYLQQYRITDSLNALCRAVELWGAIRDRQNQADILMRIGEVYRYTVAMQGLMQNVRPGLAYYHQAAQLLHPSMPLFTRLRGKCHTLTGYLHYWAGNDELAEQEARRGVASFEEPDSNWTYQTSRQHLGRILVKTGQHDEAHDLLHSTASAAVLQSPHDRARSYIALSEYFFGIRDTEQGQNYITDARQFCVEHGLHGQQQIITSIQQRFQQEHKTLRALL